VIITRHIIPLNTNHDYDFTTTTSLLALRNKVVASMAASVASQVAVGLLAREKEKERQNVQQGNGML
jgi:hypothetical protein